jgi:hypothetical protein
VKYFDFSEDVHRAVLEATTFAARLSAKTSVHRAKFPLAVVRVGFTLLRPGDVFVPGKHDLVIGAAPWSDPDLAALEDLVSQTRGRDVHVSVFDVDDLSIYDMTAMFPEMRRFLNTPMVIQYREGRLTYFGDGRDALLWLEQF